MEDLFNMLSSSARIDKSKRKKKPARQPIGIGGAARDTSHIHDTKKAISSSLQDDESHESDGDISDSDDQSQRSNERNSKQVMSNNENASKKKKKQHSAAKLAQIHSEEIAAFRRRMGIRLSHDNKHDGTLPDPISSFREWSCPSWWGGKSISKSSGGKNPDGRNGKEEKQSNEAQQFFHRLHRTLLSNIETGRWVEPTPIQMQAIPSLMEQRDVMGCAPTGSGKTGAFVLPALVLGKCPEWIYFGREKDDAGADDESEKNIKGKKKSPKSNKPQQNHNQKAQEDLKGQIRIILLAPSRELASQLHREVQRLSQNMPNKFYSALLSKSNAGMAISNKLGGKSGLDVLVATPLRLMECLERGMRLRGVRLVVLDEADRLLDASDGGSGGGLSGKDGGKEKKQTESDDEEESSSEDESDDSSSSSSSSSEANKKQKPSNDPDKQQTQAKQSGSSSSRTFLQQIDTILHHLPPQTTRALFSATLGPSVRHLSESILRSPIDISTGMHAAIGGNGAAGGVSSDTIQQELKFVGREEGKLLAIRQMVNEGITPPVLIFLQSKERAQALFGELLYDGIRVDVIHAGRSPSAREASVQKFRKGDTWVLICTDLVARGVDFKAVNLVINYDLPLDGVTYVHRIGRTGRAGRSGRAITFFTEADFENLRTIANVMRLSGCEVPDWMLTMRNKGSKVGGGGQGNRRKSLKPPKRGDIDTTPSYDKKKKRRKKQLIQNSRQKKLKVEKK